VKRYLVKANPPPTPLSLEMAPAVGPPEILCVLGIGPLRGSNACQRNRLAWPHRRRGLASDGVRYAGARSSVGGRFRSVTKLKLEWYRGVFLLLQQRSKHPREMVIMPKASTSLFLICFYQECVDGPELTDYIAAHPQSQGHMCSSARARLHASTLVCVGIGPLEMMSLSLGPPPPPPLTQHTAAKRPAAPTHECTGPASTGPRRIATKKKGRVTVLCSY